MKHLFYSFFLMVFSNVLAQSQEVAILENNENFEKMEEVRPFITDDARTVGSRMAQLETWSKFDKEGFQQWLMVAYGPTKNLEITLGGVGGYEHDANQKHVSFALPLLQLKYVFREYQSGKGPGFGVVAGSFFPVGKGGFKPAGFGAFGFATVTQCFGKDEDVLLHANLGGSYLYIDNQNTSILTCGFGMQVRAYKGWHWVGEVFSGDPYLPGVGMAYQTGVRYFVSDKIQLDTTFGNGLSGENKMPFWFSVGARFVTDRFLKSKNK